MTKVEIIEAAFRVWGRNFYRKTSLSQLATELGVSKPALYRHFINKQALTAAMAERFFDDFASFTRDDFNKAIQSKNPDDGLFTIIRSISGFFAQNVHALIFSLINIYDRNLDGRTITDSLKSRGADMNIIQQVIEKKYSNDPVTIQLIFATLTFLMSHFHKTNKSMENPPKEKDIKNITLTICKTIEKGLGYSAEKTKLDFEKLENQVNGMTLNAEPEPFFKAIAEAVAEAGPWDVSMDMVAKRLGLSKSSLYGHFKNRKDMLRRLFVTEFKRIIEFARQGIKLSANTAEQLYLGILSITVYLRSRPEILIAMGWIRTRKLELGKPEKNLEIFRLFEDVDIEQMRNIPDEERKRVSHWILFLIINILTRSIPQAADNNKKLTWLCDELCLSSGKPTAENIKNNHIRLLYKFITLGLGGFIK
ncbi:MAG: TetR/AcrR family transcriptional regulator [Treponema sp.]|nr:TetR/AcrR family transcriptional regulator [Treponema sp.]